MKSKARALSVSLALALVVTAPGSTAWANAAKAAGAATRVTVPRVTFVVGASLTLTSPAAGPHLTPAQLTAPVTVVPAPELVPGAVVAPGAIGVSPEALTAPAAHARPPLRVPAVADVDATAAPNTPVTAQAVLKTVGEEAAALGAGQLSAGEAKTRAAFELRVAPRAGLGDVAPTTTFGIFGRGAPRLAPVMSMANDAPRPDAGLPAPQATTRLAKSWDTWTQRLTDFAAIPFLALQAPQIWANITNLLGNHPEQLANLPWLGYSTGILGNMLLLSWFAGQKEKSAARVQAIGVVTSAVVVTQIFLAGYMPAAAFAVVMPTIAAGLILNWLKFKDKSPAGAWNLWSKGSSLLGLVILPQVLWATFAPAAAFSYFPAVIAGVLGLLAMNLEAKGKLPPALKSVWANLGAWTATLLFMYGPIAQLMSNFANPAGMAGIAIGTLLLAMAGNLLMLPRAMHTKNVIWFTGSAWGVAMGGWAVMLTMFLAGFAAPWLFWTATAFIPAYLAVSYLLTRASR